MGKTGLAALVLAGLLCMTSPSARAGEELFDTKTAALHIEQGLALLKAKNYDGAVREFEESAAIDPGAEAYYYLGYAYYLKSRNGDKENLGKSRENFEKSYEIDPNFSPVKIKPTEPFPAAAPQQAVKSTPTQGPGMQPSMTIMATKPSATPAAPESRQTATSIQPAQ